MPESSPRSSNPPSLLPLKSRAAKYGSSARRGERPAPERGRPGTTRPSELRRRCRRSRGCTLSHGWQQIGSLEPLGVRQLDVDRLQHDRLRFGIGGIRSELGLHGGAFRDGPCCSVLDLRKCASVKCESAPSRTRIAVTRIAPSACAVASILTIKSSISACSCTQAPPHGTASAARAAPALDLRRELVARAEVRSLDSEDDEPLGQAIERTGELDGVGEAQMVRGRREHLPGEGRCAGIEPVHSPRSRCAREHRVDEPDRSGAFERVDQARRLALTLQHLDTSRHRAAQAPRRATSPAASSRRQALPIPTTVSTAGPRGRGSASRTRCTGRSCESPARTASAVVRRRDRCDPTRTQTGPLR